MRIDIANSYYHVYARGASKQAIFLEHADYTYFLHLFTRYLSKDPTISNTGVSYPHFDKKIELLAYCLMPNHFHLLLYQCDQGALTSFMKSLMTSYSRYFNLKYGRSGSLFESRYKSAIITSDGYLLHISRYIHLNPRSWRRYPYSSFIHYVRGDEPVWLKTDRILALHDSRAEYSDFVEDYEEQKEILQEIKHKLADQ